MNRAIVLISCLLAAAGVAGYTYHSEKIASQTPVYTVMVPQRPAEPPAPASTPASPSARAAATPGDRASLARELQRELKRVGCYGGEINGVWTTSSRMAMKAFTDQVNATLPIDNPDYVLLSLVQGRQDQVCSSAEAKAPAAAPQADRAPVTEKTPSPPGEKSTTTIGAAVPAAAAAAALVSVAPKPEPRAMAPDDRPRPAAVPPPPSADPPTRAAAPDRTERAGGPVPAAGVYERRSRRAYNRSRPPRFVRNFLRSLGFR